MSNPLQSQAPQLKRHRVLVVGGLARLEQEYRCCGNDKVTVDVANDNSAKLGASLANSDSIIVVVNRVSHSAVDHVRRHARRRGTPVVHATSSSVRHVSDWISRLAHEGATS